MNRRHFLTLGAVASGTFALGGVTRLGGRPAVAQPSAPPTVDRLVLTNVVDNFYDVFARGGRLDTLTVERTPLGPSPLLAEHGLAYHIDSTRGGERRQILLDFALTDVSLFNNYRALRLDPFAADALILSHGHLDHYGALPALAAAGQGKLKPGLTVYAGGEDTFCNRVVVTPAATLDQGQLDRPALEARGLAVVLARQPVVVAGQAFTSGQIPRVTDFAPSIDPRIADWIAWLTAKPPSERPQNAAEAWDRLEEILVGLLGARWQRGARLLPGAAVPLVAAGAAAAAAPLVAGEIPTPVLDDPRSAPTLAPNPSLLGIDRTEPLREGRRVAADNGLQTTQVQGRGRRRACTAVAALARTGQEPRRLRGATPARDRGRGPRAAH